MSESITPPIRFVEYDVRQSRLQYSAASAGPRSAVLYGIICCLRRKWKIIGNNILSTKLLTLSNLSEAVYMLAYSAMKPINFNYHSSMRSMCFSKILQLPSGVGVKKC